MLPEDTQWQRLDSGSERMRHTHDASTGAPATVHTDLNHRSVEKARSTRTPRPHRLHPPSLRACLPTPGVTTSLNGRVLVAFAAAEQGCPPGRVGRPSNTQPAVVWMTCPGPSAVPAPRPARLCPGAQQHLTSRAPARVACYGTHRRSALQHEPNSPKVIVQIFPGGSDSEESACSAGDPGPIPHRGDLL